MPRKAAAVAKALQDKGMARDEKHHHMYRKSVDGVTTLVTRISHGATDISDSNLGKMAKQCCLQLREFVALVDCPLSETEWDRLVAERCVDGRNPFMGR